MSNIEASYSKSVGPDGVTFKIIPASSPDAGFSIARLLLCTIPAWIFAWLVGGVISTTVGSLLAAIGIGLNGFVMTLYTIPVVVAFFYGWYKSYRWFSRWFLRKQTEGRHAYDVELLVNTKGVTVVGSKEFFHANDIHRFVIKNAFDNTYELPMTGYVAAGSAMAVGTAVAANAMTNAVAAVANNKRRAMARISYFVTIEAGGVSHKIAGGLTDVCANGVTTDIRRALGNEIA